MSSTEVSAEERKLAEMLINSATAKNFDLSKYRDEYSAKLSKLVEGKYKRKAPAGARDDGGPVVLNLMDALRGSLARTRKPQEEHAPKKPSRHARKPAHGKRKTG